MADVPCRGPWRSYPSSPSGTSSDADVAPALREVVSRVAGLHGKSPVHLDLVSPPLLADRHERDLPGLLAGEIMGDFGGFADRRLRRSDFAPGTTAWARLPDGLARVEIDDDVIATAGDAVEQGRRAEWSQVEGAARGGVGPAGAQPLALLRLGLHTPARSSPTTSGASPAGDPLRTGRRTFLHAD